MMHAVAQRLPQLDEGREKEPASPIERIDTAELTLSLRPAGVQRALAMTVAVLVVGTFVAQLMKWQGNGLGVARFFDADVKVNFPTGFKVFALATGALLAWVIGRGAKARRDPSARHWIVLACAMAFVTVDEMAYVHQSLASFLKDNVETSGVLHYAWVLVYLPAALVLAVWFTPFLLKLPSGLRTRLVASGVLFAGGSAGVELLKGHLASTEGEEELRFLLTTALSDSLEMIGLAVFIGALLCEIGRRSPRIAVRVSSPAT